MSATRAICPSIVLARCSGGAMLGGAADRQVRLAVRVTRDAVEHVERESPPMPSVLQLVDEAQAVLVVTGAARDELVDDPLGGVAARRMRQSVAEGNRFGEL